MPEEDNAMIVLDEHLGWRPWCSGRMNAAPRPRRSTRWDAAARPCVDAIVGRYLEALGTGNGSRPPERRSEPGAKRKVEMGPPASSSDRCSPHPIATRRRQAPEVTCLTDDDMQRLEHAFVAHARVYSQAKGISYATWRESGVPARVLRNAGIRP